jgi:hypothetical protein
VALAVTADHASVFSSWAGGELVGSRPLSVAGVIPAHQSPSASPSPSEAPTGSSEPGPTASPTAAPSSKPKGKPAASGQPTPAASLSPTVSPTATGTASAPVGSPSPSPVADSVSQPVSFLIDPLTWMQTPLVRPAWRPVVDQSGRIAVYWTGGLRRERTTGIWQPDEGRLVLAAWPSLVDTTATEQSSPQPLPSSVVGTAAPGSRIPDWDARWDPSGTHLAVWVADSPESAVGHLTLLTVDPTTGRADSDRGLLAPTPAIPGFAIADGRLAWATPPGQDGQGSSLQVLAWTGNERGRVETTPLDGPEPVVVIR